MPDFCIPTRHAAIENFLIFANTDSLLAHEPVLAAHLTRRDILTANATGSIDFLNKLSGLLLDSSTINKCYFEYTTAIEKNIALVRSEVDNVSDELECEAIRCKQLSSYLANLNGKRNSKLTVAAIIVGSATTITPIFIKQTASQNILLISGGVISAGLGLLTLNPSGKQIQLVTPNNMLTDIWYGNKQSSVYPPSLWYILNDADFSNSGLASKRMMITLRWTKFDLGGTPDHATKELLFGNGGVFDQASLEIRATMLTEVVAHINSIRKDLDSFTFAFNDLKLKLLYQMHW